MALKETLKIEILAALTATSDEDKRPAVLRDEWAEKLATTVDKHLKLALTQVIGAGVPVPQDGGTGLKSTMAAAVNGL